MWLQRECRIYAEIPICKLSSHILPLFSIRTLTPIMSTWPSLPTLPTGASVTSVSLTKSAIRAACSAEWEAVCNVRGISLCRTCPAPPVLLVLGWFQWMEAIAARSVPRTVCLAWLSRLLFRAVVHWSRAFSALCLTFCFRRSALSEPMLLPRSASVRIHLQIVAIMWQMQALGPNNLL